MHDKIFLILDNDSVRYNLPHLTDLTSGFLADKIYFDNRKYEIIYAKDIINIEPNSFFGIYIISVKGHYDIWLLEQNIFYFLDNKILELAKQKKIIIVIDNQSEGYNFFNGFKTLHDTIKNLNIECVLVTGDHNFDNIYSDWCEQHNETKLVTHVTFTSWICIFYDNDRIPKYPLILDSIKNKNSLNFNSLNRSERAHRVYHIYNLWHNDLLNKGLVSANFLLEHKFFSTIYDEIHPLIFKTIMNKFLPISVDGDWRIENPDNYNSNIINHDIYKNSLLSVVTETEFFDKSLFITEKTFKPIAVGHPFIILGQYGILEKLQDLGYQVNFSMFSDYSKIKDNKERFFKVHEELKKWVNYDRKEKLLLILKNFNKIKHNQELFKKQHNYISENYNKLYETILKIKKNVNDPL